MNNTVHRNTSDIRKFKICSVENLGEYCIEANRYSAHWLYIMCHFHGGVGLWNYFRPVGEFEKHLLYMFYIVNITQGYSSMYYCYGPPLCVKIVNIKL